MRSLEAATDIQNSQLKRAFRRPNTHVQRVCDATYVMFLKKRVQGLEGLCQLEQRGLLQRLMSLIVGDTRKVSSQYISTSVWRREKGAAISRAFSRKVDPVIRHPFQREI